VDLGHAQNIRNVFPDVNTQRIISPRDGNAAEISLGVSPKACWAGGAVAHLVSLFANKHYISYISAMSRNEAFSNWVERIGAERAAELLGVSVPAVYHWCSGRRKIGAERAIQIEAVTNGALRREQLRPDLFSLSPPRGIARAS